MNDSGLPAILRSPGFQPVEAHTTTSEGVSIVCYENDVPAFVESELERLYASLYSSLPAIRLYSPAGQLSTYVVRKGGDIVTLWLFQHKDREVRVINEAIAITTEDVRRFCTYIFGTCESVRVVSFHAVQSLLSGLAYPHQRFNCTEDSILALPATCDEYLTCLGKATRKNIRRYLSRLTKSFPSFRYRTYPAEEIEDEHVREIISLNRVRMARKGKVSGIDAEEEQRIVQLARQRGFIGVATIDGKVCGGAIAFRFRRNYFSFVRAHDPAYDSFRLGLLGAYLLISECIARGGKELHFMWGREGHKSLLLGAQKYLDHVTVYRSAAQLLLNADMVLKHAFSGYVRDAKMRFLDTARRGNGLVSRLANKLLQALRQLKAISLRRQENPKRENEPWSGY